MRNRHRLPHYLLIGALLAAAAVAAGVQAADLCLECHDEPAPQAYEASLHGAAGIGCVDCHVDLSATEPHEDTPAPARCDDCHPDVQEVYAESLHAYARERGSLRAPTCASCHGAHDIRAVADPDSPAHPDRLQETCATCHGPGRLTDEIVKLAGTLTLVDYTRSVHGAGAATCTDCHGIHDMRGVGNPRSRVHANNVGETCGTCHDDVLGVYRASIHGRALQAGVRDSPTCTDCHGEHLILSSSAIRTRSPHAFAGRVATEACGDCHNDPVHHREVQLARRRASAIHTSTATTAGPPVAGTCQCGDLCQLPYGPCGASGGAPRNRVIHPDNLLTTCQAVSSGRRTERFARQATPTRAVSITANPINQVDSQHLLDAHLGRHRWDACCCTTS